LNNKLTLATIKISTIFLAIVLVTGTIALASSQSYFMVGTNVQAQPYYGGGMDNRYDDRKSYGMNSYGSSNYGNDNSYASDYGMKNDRKSYGNDYGHESQYQQPSYKPDYKPQYSSYDGKDNKRDKSQKDSKSVSINKFNCINTNININGNNTGDINVGNKGAAAEEGYLGGGYSSADGSGGYDGNAAGYYDNKYDNNKQGKGFDCIINNNNTNTNIVTGGAGNVTDGNVTETTCEECFAQVLNATELARLQVALGNGINVTITVGTPQIEINSLGELCDVLENLTGAQLVSVVGQILRAAGITLTSAEFFELITCIGRALDITIPPTRGLATFDINTGGLASSDINTGSPASSFSPPNTIAQGIGDSSEALAKITKLKQQWLDLLP
jgi:hypothetical protein